MPKASDLPDAQGSLITELNVAAPMRDGTILRCDIARPSGDGRWPTIISRTPYGKETWFGMGPCSMQGLASLGFVVVIQDCRQRFASGGEGDYQPFINDANDGEDTIAWASELPYSTGDVFLMGMSYHGFTQWAAAVRRPPALRAISPVESPSTPWRTLAYRGGVLELGALAGWYMGVGADILMRRYRDRPEILGPAMGKYVATLASLHSSGYASLPIDRFAPLVDNQVGDQFVRFVKSTHANEDPQVRALEAAADYTRVAVPAYILGGWYDYFGQGSIDQFLAMKASAATPEARARTRLVMGPWTHGNQLAMVGERWFGPMGGPQAVGQGGVVNDMMSFFRQQIGQAGPSAAPVKIFVMGANMWRDEQEWPIARRQETPWYLSSGGQANTAAGNGCFSPDPRPGAPDQFTYDPADPVPVCGGSNLGVMELAGPRDQTRVEARKDVLVYTSEPLAQPLEVTGMVMAELWVETSAVDTDFVVRLVDVQPDGVPYNIAEGVLRCRFRDDPIQTLSAKPMKPGEPTLLRIALSPTSNLFEKDHRLRVQVTSSCFPRWARNLNIWNQLDATLAQSQVAHQTVLHDQAHPSRLILPIIPPKA